MSSANTSELLGFAISYDNDERTLAVIETPFTFWDQDPVPICLEQVGDKIRFFDDGEVIWNFLGNEVHLNEPRFVEIICELVRPEGVYLNQSDELEISGDPADAPTMFARFLSALTAVLRWEREQQMLYERRRRESMAEDTASPTVSA